MNKEHLAHLPKAAHASEKKARSTLSLFSLLLHHDARSCACFSCALVVNTLREVL